MRDNSIYQKGLIAIPSGAKTTTITGDWIPFPDESESITFHIAMESITTLNDIANWTLSFDYTVDGGSTPVAMDAENIRPGDYPGTTTKWTLILDGDINEGDVLICGVSPNVAKGIEIRPVFTALGSPSASFYVHAVGTHLAVQSSGPSSVEPPLG